MSDKREDTKQTMETLKGYVHRCRDCCSGNYLSYHCPLCPADKFKPTRLQRVENHLNVHWKTRVQGTNGLYSVVCHQSHNTFEACSHFHCPSCGKIYKSRKQNLVNHVARCQRQEEGQNINAEEPQDNAINEEIGRPDNSNQDLQSPNSDPSVKNTTKGSQDISDHISYARPANARIKRTKSKKCSICHKFISVKWIRNHLKFHRKRTTTGDINTNRHHYTVLIDSRHGVYTSAVNINGPRIPIHIKKLTSGPEKESFCENNNCINLKNTASRGQNMSYECPHIRSIPYAKAGRYVDLDISKLREMTDRHIITEERYNEVSACRARSLEADSPFIVEIPCDELTSDRYLHFSIFIGSVRYWSRLQRTITTYDTVTNTITCRCSRSKRYCPHKVIVKWFLFQERPEIYSSLQNDPSTDEELTENETAQDGMSTANFEQVSSQNLEYVKENKRIPSKISFYGCIQTHEMEQFQEIIPPEECCQSCGTRLESVYVQKSKVIMLQRVLRDVKVFEKICRVCKRVYTYQEYNEGIHNFHNKVFLGLDVCKFIRCGLQNHIAIGRSISVLQDVLEVSLNSEEITKAYLHFEALSNHSYDFNCVMCGYHPPVLIWDTFRKARFRYAVSEIKVPDNANELVDMKRFWCEVEDGILNAGIKGQNTREFKPAFEYWAPWIGDKSRKSDLAFNTEFKKCLSITEDDSITEPMPEEIILNLLRDEKVTNIRRVCRAAGISAEGSTMDMILRMREKSISRGCFDKAYEKVFGCSGGWAVGCCGHGVVYAIKNLLRSESPRDYIDIERSLKHRPNISICDIAHLLARHGNKTEQNFFSPHEGRLTAVSEDTLVDVENGRCNFSAEFLSNLSPSETPSDNRDYNPITRSAIHLSLFDWFHENNCKKREEILRKASLVKELSGMIDTQAVEQLFNSNKRDIYFMNNLSPIHHLFLYRLKIHLRNESINKILTKQMNQAFGELTVNSYGQMMEGYLNRSENRPEDQNVSEETYFEDFEINIEAAGNENTLTVESSRERTDRSARLSLHYREAEGLVSDRRVNIPEIARLFEMAMVTLDSGNSLTEEEMNNLLSNLRYANRVLYRHAEFSRRLQVKTVETQFGPMQIQGNSNYCGLCCINNVVGRNANGRFPTDILTMDTIADEMWLDMLDNPQFGLLNRLEPLRDREGYYSFDVMQSVLEGMGLQTLRISHESVRGMNPLQIVQLVKAQSECRKSSLIVRLQTSEHWLSLDINESNCLIYDPIQERPEEHSDESIGNFIKMHAQHPGAVYLVYSMSVPSAQYQESKVEAEEVITVQNNRQDGKTKKNKQPQKPHQYQLRKNPKKKRGSIWEYAPLKRKRYNRDAYIENLPTEILEPILKEVVYQDGDIAYLRLSLVCKRWFKICTAEKFQNECHIRWLYSLRPQSFWDDQRNRPFLRPFKLLDCMLCGERFKSEGPGYWGGKGIKGEFRGWYEELGHPGFCSHFCFMIAQDGW